MIRSFAGSLRHATALAILAVTTAACDSLLVAPAGKPLAGTLAFALNPTPGSDLGAEDANRARVQVEADEVLLLDTIVEFAPGSDDFEVPVPFAGPAAFVRVRVELRRDFLPLLRGSASAEIRARRVNDIPLDLEGPVPLPLSPATEVSAGVYHSCAAAEASTYCWGTNEDLQLGSADAGISTLPVPAGGGLPLTSVSTGYLTTCGLDSTGRALCWGSNLRGSLGVGSQAEESATPLPIGGPLRFTSVSVGGLHGCALTAEGLAYCWGFNGFGQLGDGTATDRDTPVRAGGSLRFLAIEAGYVHTCGIAGDGFTYCWGLNEFGQLGDGTQSDRSTPTRVLGQQRFASLSAGGLHTCGVAVDQSISCWGYNRFGQLGIGSEDSMLQPTPISGGNTPFTSVSAGGLHSCGITVDAEARCWGYNRSGTVGDGTTTDASTPAVVLTNGVALQSISSGLHHTCAITTDGRPACWGYNQFGQVGDGSLLNREIPQEVLRVEAFLADRLPEESLLTDRLDALLAGRVDP